jgi:hypothetical protein
MTHRLPLPLAMANSNPIFVLKILARHPTNKQHQQQQRVPIQSMIACLVVTVVNGEEFLSMEQQQRVAVCLFVYVCK